MVKSLADLQFLGFVLSVFHGAAESINDGRQVRNHGRELRICMGPIRTEVVVFPSNHFSARVYNFIRIAWMFAMFGWSQP